MITRFTAIWVAIFAVGVAFSSTAADTWYWLASTNQKDAGGTASHGKTYAAKANWENVATGENGIPVSGDFVISQGKGAFGADFSTSLAFGGVTIASSTSSELVSQGTLTMQAGGAGFVAGENVTSLGTGANGKIAYTGSGEGVMDIRNPSCTFVIQKSCYGNANITLVKKGAGTLQVNDYYFNPGEGRDYTGNYYQHRNLEFGGMKLQEGTFYALLYYRVKDMDFQFDGNGAALNLYGKTYSNHVPWSLRLLGGKFRETANCTAGTHKVTAEALPGVLECVGTREDTSFSGLYTGFAGLTWNPDNDVEFAFKRNVMDTKGVFIVSNGTIRVTEGASFPNLSSVTVSGANAKFQVDASAGQVFPSTALAVANGGKLMLPTGVHAAFKAMTLNGVAVADGVYSASGDIGSKVDWIVGDGYAVIGRIPDPAAVAATWNGTGNATTLANWNGAAELPALNDGSAQVAVEGGSSFVADTDVWVKGFTLGVTPFAFSAVAGKELWIGSSGISAAGKVVTVGAADGCVVAAGAQTWNIGNGTLAINGDVGSVGNDALWIKGTGKNALDLNAATPSWTAPVFITNMVVNFKASGALGPTGANPAYLFQAPTFAGGITVDRDLWIAVSSVIKPTTSSDLTFNGFVCSTNKQSMDIVAPAGTKITFNKLMMSRNGGTMKGAGTIVFNDSCHFRDRPSMQETVTVELHKDGNRLNGNMGTFSGGRLKAMKPYVITKANTRRQTKDGAGSSSDSAANTMINSKSNFILDLNGFDQSIDQLAMHANGTSSGGHVTSATPATLHLQTEKSWWPNHNYTYGFSDYYNSADPDKTRSKADSYGYETADKGYWEGGVTLSYEAATDMVRSMMRESSSTGNVEVVSGTLVFLRRAKTTNETFDLKGGSANPYRRLANEDGAWTNATKAVVKGGVLKLEHGKAFGKQTAFELNSAGKLQLEAGVRQSCASLTLNGVEASVGTYGSTASDAQYKNDDYFTGKGVLKVGKIGIYILIR